MISVQELHGLRLIGKIANHKPGAAARPTESASPLLEWSGASQIDVDQSKVALLIGLLLLVKTALILFGV